MLDAAEVIEQNWRVRLLTTYFITVLILISCDSEFARVYGVDFRSVRTRGSQFKVESVLFKLSKPESFMMLSPSRVDVSKTLPDLKRNLTYFSRRQVGRQNAAECQPLIMEPESAFYKGPLVVLDFTSLYPSVVIAHNYCWS